MATRADPDRSANQSRRRGDCSRAGHRIAADRDERIVDAYRTVIEACNAQGKFAGIGGVYEESLMRRYIGMGVRLVLGGGDLGFMTAAATERAKLLRDCR